MGTRKPPLSQAAVIPEHRKKHTASPGIEMGSKPAQKV